MASTKGAHRVLVVDDEPQICALLREVLSLDGHMVFTARHGGEALKALGNGKYSFLIMDLTMPVKGGLETLRDLRDRGHAMPVLLMSSHFPDDVRRACTGQKGLMLLEKPFSLTELRKIVARHTPARA
ncbi:MAG TPA: response regulator [Planctomycetota bacterium]|nr:response regulator [Planctomycetota bacterium]